MRSTSFIWAAVSPDWEEWASSIRIANRPSTSSMVSSWLANGNFCSVVVMILADGRVSASASSRDESTDTTRPLADRCSNCSTVADSCASSTRRSVTTTTLSKILDTPSAAVIDVSRWANHAMVLDLPDPAECCTR